MDYSVMRESEASGVNRAPVPHEKYSQVKRLAKMQQKWVS